MDILKGAPVNMEVAVVLNRRVKVCEKALGIHIPTAPSSRFHPQLPPYN